MSLASLAQSAWEVLLSYLEPHHLARLFLTGDKRVQHAVVFTHRCTDFSDTPDDVALVDDVLLPHTVHATVTSRRLRALSARGHTGIKSLTVGTRDYDDHCPIDLTSAVNLEALQFRVSAYTGLTLPASLTRLLLGHNSIDCIVAFGSLVNLVELETRLTTAQLTSFERDASWPAGLTSLRISFHTDRTNKDAEMFRDSLRMLPPTLSTLALYDMSTRWEEGVFDIVPPAVCSRLESFEMAGPCRYDESASRHFPPSLTSLEVEKLPLSLGLMRALTTCSNLVHLKLKNVDSTPGHLMEPWRETVCILLSRLDLESVEKIVRYASYWWPHNGAVVEAVSAALVRVGLGEAYANFAKFLIFCTPLAERTLSALGESPHIRRVLGYERVRAMVAQRARATPSLYQWQMRLGVRDEFCASETALLGRRRLHQNVRTLVVDAGYDGRDLQLLNCVDDASGVESIVLQEGNWHFFVQWLYAQRRKFPVLNEVVFKASDVEARLSEETNVTLARMRLYPSRDSPTLRCQRVYRYRVVPP